MENKNIGLVTEVVNNNSLKVLKWVGISIVAITATVIIAKKIKKRKEDKDKNNMLKAIAKNINESNLSYDDAWYKTQAQKLYNACDPTSWTDLLQNFDEGEIIKVLKQLKNADDYGQLVTEFGLRRNNPTKEDLDLPSFLQKSGSSDLAEYNKILTDIGVKTLL